jgi:hypothetical protein
MKASAKLSANAIRRMTFLILPFLLLQTVRYDRVDPSSNLRSQMFASVIDKPEQTREESLSWFIPVKTAV